MSFGTDLKRFQEKVEFRTHEVFVNTAAAVHSGIQNGDPRTGAPGQAVQSGNLKASWQLRFESAILAEISTNSEYALQEEDGISYAHGGTPITHRSAVGGFHSVALTRAGIQNVVDDETQKLYGANP